LVILAPIGVTAYALFFIFQSVDNLVPFDLPPGVGFIIVIFLVAFIGFLGTRLFFGRWIFEALDYLMEHTPGIKFIYSSVKEIIESFMGDKKKFNDPVWVKVQDNPEIWRIGFLTQKNMQDAFQDEGSVAVYLPHSYAISGWVIITKAINTRPVKNMNAVEAMKFAVSGGVTGNTPENKK